MVSSTSGWAVGGDGSILQWDGTGWTNITIRGNFQSVAMLSSTDGWAVGLSGTIIRWDGTSWTNASSPTTAWLKSVDLVSPTDGWIVGADGTIIHWQEDVPDFPIEYLIIVGVAAVIAAVWFFRKRLIST